MERNKGETMKSIMKANEVARHLLISCETLRKYDSYMFGSSLFGTGSDFDILIVGPSGELLTTLKEELRFAGKELPLDVLYMLPNEVKQSGFVTNKGCINLAELAKIL